MRIDRSTLLVLAGAAGLAAAAALAQETGPPAPGNSGSDDALAEAFGAAGIQVDPDAGALAFPAAIEVRNELLEYLLTLEHGAVHETLFVADVDAQVLNAAFLALGLERGRNVDYVPKDPPPTPEEQRAGVRAFDVVPPEGDGVYLHAAWREGDELFFYRVEDLVRDLDRGRTMRRHPWVYLGSRMVPSRAAGGDVFAAQAEGNLACISFFTAGNTLLTAALPECVAQTTWLPNAWLLPDRTAEVMLVASLEPLTEPPASFAEAVPVVPDALVAPQAR